jgi:hypothetical protein
MCVEIDQTRKQRGAAEIDDRAPSGICDVLPADAMRIAANDDDCGSLSRWRQCRRSSWRRG